MYAVRSSGPKDDRITVACVVALIVGSCAAGVVFGRKLAQTERNPRDLPTADQTYATVTGRRYTLPIDSDRTIYSDALAHAYVDKFV